MTKVAKVSVALLLGIGVAGFMLPPFYTLVSVGHSWGFW